MFMELQCAHFFYSLFYLFFTFMDSGTDTSYQDDILKVKQIWSDIKEVGKSENKKPQTSKELKKHQNGNKANKGSKPTKTKLKPQESKSQINLNPQKNPPQAQKNIITFSTQKPHTISNQPHSNPTDQPTFQSNHLTTNFHHRQAIQQKDLELSLLRVDNQRLKDQISRLQKKIQEKEEVIQGYKKREDELLGVTRKFSREKVGEVERGVEYTNYKSDSKRLLKMLEQTEEYKNFAKMAIDDEGVRHLRLAGKKSKIDLSDGFNKQNPSKHLHFCTCHPQFIPQANFWVPQKVYDFSKDYVKQHKGEELSEAELELLLYELNKIWREREKRIANWLKGENARDVGKYKRKVQGMIREGKGQQRE